MRFSGIFLKGFAAVVSICLAGISSAADWPMWGYDAGRGNAVETSLPARLELAWVRELPEPVRAWPFQYEDYYTGGNPQGAGKLSFDVSYEPVAGGGNLFVPSMRTDSVTAYSIATGGEIWRFYAGGPVRFAPAYRENKVYFVSDDGYLYCLDAGSGELLWKFRGSFSTRKVLGNGRFISIWPARGAPVIKDGVVYFAAGVLPFEGVFVHAVCADTGGALWTNSTSGSLWDLHQHGGAWSYGGPSPQGYLAVSGGRLIVPGGRTPPAVYDLETGRFLYFRQATGEVGKGAGGYRVHAYGDWFFNHGMLYSLEDGAQYGPLPGTVLSGDVFMGASGGRLVAHCADIRETEEEVADRLERRAIAKKYEVKMLWRDSDRGIEELFFRAGRHLGASAAGGRALLVELGGDGSPADIAWEHAVEGRIWRMFPASGRLFVVTECGKIYCFAEATPESGPARHVEAPAEAPPGSAGRLFAESVIGLTGKDEGYAVVSGGDSGFLAALAEKTGLHLLAAGAGESGAGRARRELGAAGLYGGRVAVMEGSLQDLRLPPYTAELVVLAGGEHGREEIERAYGLLRPYGGMMYAAGAGREIEEYELDKAVFKYGAGYALIERKGRLAGAGRWTHQYGSAANRTYSGDELVKPPLGTIWFGGTSNLNALPRHHNGPIPQVAGGRLFILGVETLSARCVYTGRELWVKDMPGIGHPFTCLRHEEQFMAGREVYMPNHPGANFIGSPYVSLEDAVYVIHGASLLELDPATGETLRDFRLPDLGVSRNEWGHLMVWEDYIIAAVDPQHFDEEEPGKAGTWNATSSSLLAVMDRNSGSVIWVKRAGRVGFRHNAIAAGNGKLFAVDGLSGEVVDVLRRRGMDAETDAVLIAFDIATGRELWRREDAFGTWLGYYEDEDILLEGGRHGQRGALPDEPRRNLFARRGATGEVIWRHGRGYSGPLGLHEDMIIPGRPGERFISPLTGETIRMEHPLTGREYDFGYHRYYGCGTMNSSRHLVMFRSGAAGFADLAEFGGTANLGGFRSGCTNNLVAADGVLNAPEYTRTCTCSYQLQTSLGFVHMPDVEMWTYNRLPEARGPVQSAGINLGAPGGRRDGGVLWLEVPKVYPQGPEVPVRVEGAGKRFFGNHASWIENPGEGRPWVASYGVEGLESLSVDLGGGADVFYDLTLYFAEPGGAAAGDRVFDVYVQGEKLLEGLDVFERAGGGRRVYMAFVEGVPAAGRLDLAFSPEEGSLPAVLSGIEIVVSR